MYSVHWMPYSSWAGFGVSIFTHVAVLLGWYQSKDCWGQSEENLLKRILKRITIHGCTRSALHKSIRLRNWEVTLSLCWLVALFCTYVLWTLLASTSQNPIKSRDAAPQETLGYTPHFLLCLLPTPSHTRIREETKSSEKKNHILLIIFIHNYKNRYK